MLVVQASGFSLQSDLVLGAAEWCVALSTAVIRPWGSLRCLLQVLVLVGLGKC